LQRSIRRRQAAPARRPASRVRTPGPSNPARSNNDHEESAERQRQAADPDHPAGTDAFFDAGAGLPAAAGVGASPRCCRWRRSAWRPVRRERGDRFSIADRGRLFGCNTWGPDKGSLFKLVVRRKRRRARSCLHRPCLQWGRFHRLEPRAQYSNLMNALRATISATRAIISERKSSIKPPGDRPDLWAYRIKSRTLGPCRPADSAAGRQRRARTRRPGAGRSWSTSRRKRNNAAGRPPVCVDITPVVRQGRRIPPGDGNSACADAAPRSLPRSAAVQ